MVNINLDIKDEQTRSEVFDLLSTGEVSNCVRDILFRRGRDVGNMDNEMIVPVRRVSFSQLTIVGEEIQVNVHVFAGGITLFNPYAYHGSRFFLSALTNAHYLHNVIREAIQLLGHEPRVAHHAASSSNGSAALATTAPTNRAQLKSEKVEKIIQQVMEGLFERYKKNSILIRPTHTQLTQKWLDEAVLTSQAKSVTGYIDSCAGRTPCTLFCNEIGSGANSIGVCHHGLVDLNAGNFSQVLKITPIRISAMAEVRALELLYPDDSVGSRLINVKLGENREAPGLCHYYVINVGPLGITLDHVLCQLKGSDKVRIYEELVAAVKHAHEKGVILHDICPENMVAHFRPNGEVYFKLIDLGSADIYSVEQAKERKKFTWHGRFNHMPLPMQEAVHKPKGRQGRPRVETFNNNYRVRTYRCNDGFSAFEVCEFLDFQALLISILLISLEYGSNQLVMKKISIAVLGVSSSQIGLINLNCKLSASHTVFQQRLSQLLALFQVIKGGLDDSLLQCISWWNTKIKNSPWLMSDVRKMINPVCEDMRELWEKSLDGPNESLVQPYSMPGMASS